MSLDGQIEVSARQHGGRVGNCLRTDPAEFRASQGGQARDGNPLDKAAPGQRQTRLSFLRADDGLPSRKRQVHFDSQERVCAVALRYLVLNVLMGLDTPSFTPVALIDSTV